MQGFNRKLGETTTLDRNKTHCDNSIPQLEYGLTSAPQSPVSCPCCTHGSTWKNREPPLQICADKYMDKLSIRNTHSAGSKVFLVLSGICSWFIASTLPCCVIEHKYPLIEGKGFSSLSSWIITQKNIHLQINNVIKPRVHQTSFNTTKLNEL